jgi:hypothetical protein
MGQPVVIVAGEEPGATTAEFQAGVAAATSVVAAGTAAEAEQSAERAEEIAEGAARAASEAVSEAIAAEITAETAHNRIDDLYDDLEQLRDDVVSLLNGPAETVVVDDVAANGGPELVATETKIEVEETSKPVTEPKPASSRGFGNDRWFGARR